MASNRTTRDLRWLIEMEREVARRSELLVEDTRRCIGETKALCRLSSKRLMFARQNLFAISFRDIGGVDSDH